MLYTERQLNERIKIALMHLNREWEDALRPLAPRPPLHPEMVPAWASRLPRHDPELEADYEALCAERDDLLAEIDDLSAALEASKDGKDAS